MMSDCPLPAVWEPLSQHSSFCRRVLSLWPAAAQQLLDGNRLHTAGVPALHFSPALETAVFDQLLREYRQTECLRIAWRDVNNAASLAETLEDLTVLAESCLQACVTFHLQQLQQAFGHPLINNETPAQFCILGMGKLGGGELNFSSDLDLLFIYSGKGKTSGQRRITCLDFFTRLARRIVHSLDAVTVHGQVYRIDTRLRPYGSMGKLVWNSTAMEQYYASEGRDWERYALLKSRPVAGDISLGSDLLSELQPFIYRRYLDYGLFDGVRQLRHEIARAAARQDHRNNLKLGPGGIREIEFLVQSLQLLRGGQHPELRHHNLLHSLMLLQQHNFLPADTADLLNKAYCLLRQLENRLQMLDDQQRHSIPDNQAQLHNWFGLSGYSDSAHLLEELNQLRDQVAEQFDFWFGDDAEQQPPFQLQKSDDLSGWTALLQSTLGDLDTAELTAFESCFKRILKHSLTQDGRNRLQRLLPKMLSAAADTPAPVKAALHGLTLLEKIAGRSNYLALLLEQPAALRRMLDYGARSDWVAHQLQLQPALLDELIDPITLKHMPASKQGYIDQALALTQPSEQTLEQQLALLQQWRQSSSLRIAANALFQQLDTPQSQWHLSCLAEACLQAVNAICRHLIPSSIPLTIVAYGTLGASEMHYASDLDLVFLYADDVTTPGRSTNRQVQKLIHLLTTIGPNSQLYEIDTRLRPNGQSGTLISSIGAFHDYQFKHAWVWEWQALCRARPIVSDDHMAALFHRTRHGILQPARERLEIQNAISEMLARIQSQEQHDAYAMSRIRLQFIVQSWLLIHALPDASIPYNLVDQAQWLADHFPHLTEDAMLAASNYQLLQAHQHRQQLGRANTSAAPSVTDVDALWDRHFPD